MDNFKDITISQLIKMLQDVQPSGEDPIVRFYDMTDDAMNMSFFVRSIGVSKPVNSRGSTNFIIALGKIGNTELV